MAITYEQTAAAAEQIKAGGGSPTVKAVRGLLGSGSETTITKHLQAWRAGTGNEERAAEQAAGGTLAPVVRTMARALDAATADAAKRAEEAEARAAAAEQRAAAAEARAAAAEQRAAEATGEARAAAKAAAEAAKRLEAEQEARITAQAEARAAAKAAAAAGARERAAIERAAKAQTKAKATTKPTPKAGGAVATKKAKTQTKTRRQGNEQANKTDEPRQRKNRASGATISKRGTV